MTRPFAPARLAAAVAFVLIAPSFVTAAEPARAPAPRALYPKFDLTYMPEVESQGLIAFRPAEIARHASSPELSGVTRACVAMCFEMLGAGDPEAAEPPPFADIEQCVLCLSLRLTGPTANDRATLIMGGCTPCVMRTTKPFDWEGAARKWFPKMTRVRHEGRSYLRMPVLAGPVAPDPFALCFPDDRTLVCGCEGDIRALLRRLAKGGAAPEAPAGWAEVDRDFAAVVLDNRKVPAVSGNFPVSYPAGQELESLAGSLRTVAVGLSIGGTTRVRVVATVKSGQTAKAVAALHKLIEVASEAAVGEGAATPLEVFGAELVKHVAVDADGDRITVAATADGNIAKLILATFRGPD